MAYQFNPAVSAPDPSDYGTPYDNDPDQGPPLAPVPPTPLNPPLDWNDPAQRSKILAVTGVDHTGGSRIVNPYTDSQGSYHPSMEITDVAGQKDLPAPQSLQDQMDSDIGPINVKLSKLVQTQGPYHDTASYMADVNQMAYKKAIALGIDPASQEGQQWLQTTLNHAKQSAGDYIVPMDSKNFIKLKDPFGGEVLINPYNGKQFKADVSVPNLPDTSNADPNDSWAKINAMHEEVKKNPALGKLPVYQQSEKLFLQHQKEEDAAKDDTPLTDKAVKAMAQQYAKTGMLPAFGMGKTASANRNKVINQYTQDLEDNGSSISDTVANQQSFKADSAELKALHNQRGPIMAFEKTAELNMQQIKDLSPQLDRTKFPLINQAIQSGRTKITGDPIASAYAVAVKTVADEYTRILSGQKGMSTDAAKSHTQELLNTAQNDEQMQAVLKQMQIDMTNRGKGYDQQIQETVDRLSGKPSQSQSDERVDVVSPTGKIGHIPKSQLPEAVKAGYKLKK